jgi:hypothetical protein
MTNEGRGVGTMLAGALMFVLFAFAVWLMRQC